MPQKLANIISYFKSTKTKFISLELCPDRDLDVDKLVRLRPAFCSVTWLNNDLHHIPTHSSMTLTSNLQKNKDISVLLHLPGRILTAQTAVSVLNLARNEGVTGIFAMQGENALMRGLDATPDDFKYAGDLVKFTRQHFEGDFSIAVAGYPEGHPHAESLQTDLEYLKAKVDAGADFIITQSIFDPASFRPFHRKCRELGITVPIVPGIYIINTHAALLGMQKFCKLSIPQDILAFVEEHKEDNAAVREYGIGKAAEIITALFEDQEAPILGVHIFTLNDLGLVEDVFKTMGFTNATVV